MSDPILYQFHVAGYIPGLPDGFSAGSWAKVDPITNELLETGLLTPPVDEPPAPQEDQSSVPPQDQPQGV